jgi:hypothetical protein
MRALNGVGDLALGQWVEDGDRGVAHVRRRLSAEEVRATGIVVRDIRGTDEERERLATLLAEAPHLAAYLG